MSGVMGVYSSSGGAFGRDLMERMAREAPERGPDGLRLWQAGRIILGHLHLKATPESENEEQPATLSEKPHAVTFDGVLYNRDELVRALDPSPTSGRSSLLSDPDSLLVLRAYVRWGAEFLMKVNGDFSLAIWDGEKEELLAAVDPVGIRQIFYCQPCGFFVFASDERQLLTFPEVSQELDRLVVRSFLAGSFPGDGRTVFRDIKFLPGGHAIRVGSSGVMKWRYWRPGPAELHFRRDDDYREHFRELLTEAVEARLRARGPVGCWLSGGVDSSSLTALAAQQGGNIVCLTARFPRQVYDECDRAREVSLRYGLPHIMVDQESGNLWEAAGRFLEYQATPFLSQDPDVIEKTAAATRDAGCRVCLMGVGGDEVLASWSILFHLFRRFHWIHWWREVRHLCRMERRPFFRALLAFVKEASPAPLRRVGSRWKWSIRDVLGPGPAPRGLARVAGLAGSDAYELSSPIIWLRRPGPSEGTMFNFLAWRVRALSRFGIEIRYPFLDRRIIEFTLGLPPRLLHRNGFTKAILREALGDILPASVRNEIRGAEFSSRLDQELRGTQSNRLRNLFSGDLMSAPFLRPEGARGMVEKYLAGASVLRWNLWYLLCLELWLRLRDASRGSSKPKTRCNSSHFGLDRVGEC